MSKVKIVKIVLITMFVFGACGLVFEMFTYHVGIIWSWLADSFGLPPMPHKVALSFVVLLSSVLVFIGGVFVSRSSGR